ncbi:MAG: hypothetical protein KGJ07_05395 [Patescibacteria group bacterium]|nr:hypothetical protein [Patescibacteria group bacterium]MDE2589121.1 hypothetical protein [Patescibacteria group bacterium]
MKRLALLVIFLVTFLLTVSPVLAVTDPRSLPNNKFGVHILFPSELEDAAKIVNGNGGDWGYVTIPIQAGDKDIRKWQAFMDEARQLHVIPIMRLATEGDYFVTGTWRKPTYDDILDFANFLNSLTWPTKNRYIIVFNEVNRGDEWAGQADPAEYADLLSYAVTIFKSTNPDFFIISAGLDNAAANSDTSYNEYTFLSQMDREIPGIFNQVDGLGSHSYPNPAFSEPPSILNSESIDSFYYERELAFRLSGKDLPVFITETGWSKGEISADIIAKYFHTAFTSVWNDPNVVAVTPFLLEAGGGPFLNFSLLSPSLTDTPLSTELKNEPKTKGQPELTPVVLAAETVIDPSTLPVLNFSSKKKTVTSTLPPEYQIKVFAKYLLHLK